MKSLKTPYKKNFQEYSKLTFEPQVGNLGKEAGQKLHALARNANYIDKSKKSNTINTFVVSQFSYCPLIRMFHSKRT